jgi:hypothetical protein
MPNVSTEVKSEVESSVETKKVAKDTTIVADRTVIKLITAVDNVDTKLSTKWGELIEYCVTSNLSSGTPEQVKRGKAVLFKSLQEAGKTDPSAYSIRSFILKVSKPENKWILDGLKAGTMTVRDARNAGSKPQASPNLTNKDKYDRALNDAARFAVALNIGLLQIREDAQSALSQYMAAQEEKKNKS